MNRLQMLQKIGELEQVRIEYQDLSENHVMWVQFSWLIKIFTN
jgi:hypothetical protein